MRFGLLRTISVNRLGCAKRTRLVSVAHRARRWLYRFYRIEGAVNSATLRAPPNLGRLRDVHTNSDGAKGDRHTSFSITQLDVLTYRVLGLGERVHARSHACPTSPLSRAWLLRD